VSRKWIRRFSFKKKIISIFPLPIKVRVRFISFWTITRRPKRFSINNAQITQRPRPGELGRAELRLGDAGINIKYGYGGTQARDELRFVSFSLAANLDWQPYVG
jgi:hypothetical protein